MAAAFLLPLLLLLAPAAVSGQQQRTNTATYPVKSINLEAAMAPEFFATATLSQWAYFGRVADPHAVHGITTSDGGYLLVGKAAESEDSARVEGFAVKLDATGGYRWGWKSGLSNADDVLNAAVQLPNGGDLLAVGYRTINGVAHRSITKLDLATGAERWTASFDDSSGSHGAFEMIDLSPDGHLLLGGLRNKRNTEEIKFKSYGNTEGGQAVVMKIPLAAAAGSAAITLTDVAHQKVMPSLHTCKAARPFANGNVACLVMADGRGAGLVVLTAQLEVVWGPTFYASHGEGSDIAVSADGSAIAISGHGGAAGVLEGRLSSIDASSGALRWIRSFDTGSIPEIVRHECWGVLPMPDNGFTLVCGTGIEPDTCRSLSGTTRTRCNSGIGDLRAGAVARAPDVWASFVVRTTAAGDRLWQRIDSKQENDGSAVSSSAAEWAVFTDDGGIAVITDETDGFGVLKLGAEPGAQPTAPPAPTTAAPTSPPTTPAPTAASEHLLREVGNCNLAGFRAIGNPADCAAAATALRLADTTVSTLTNDNRPQGCFYKASNRGNKLYFNRAGDAISSDTTRASICARSTATTANPSSAPPPPPPPPTPGSGARTLLVIGDSAGEFLGDYMDQGLLALPSECSAVAVHNVAVTSSTAAQWEANSRCPEDGSRSCSLEDAKAAVPNGPASVTTVLLFAGGNDFLDAGCPTGAGARNQLKATLKRLIFKTHTAFPQANILVTNYFYPPSDLEGSCSRGNNFDRDGIAGLAPTLIAAAAESDPSYVRFVDTSELFGGSASSFSDARYFADSIHLNPLGYRTLFSQPSVQQIIGCQGAPSAPPTTRAPATAAPTTVAPTTEAPTTRSPTNSAPTASPPTTAASSAPTVAPPGECTNNAYFCDIWASLGYCVAAFGHDDYMNAQCALACHACPGEEHPTPPRNTQLTTVSPRARRVLVRGREVKIVDQSMANNILRSIEEATFTRRWAFTLCLRVAVETGSLLVFPRIGRQVTPG